MFNSPFDNVSTFDRLARMALGSFMVAAIFYPGVTATWLALLAIYPFTTAVIAWDPLYALINQVKLHMPTKGRLGTHAHA